MRNNRLRTIGVTLVLVIIVFFTAIYMTRCYSIAPQWWHRPLTISTEPVVFNHQVFSPGNQLQPNASVRMTVVENKLYLYIPTANTLVAGPYDGYLCRFDGSDFQKVKRIPNNILDLWDGKLYYNVSDDNTNTLICYQLSSNETVPVVSYTHRTSKTESSRSGADGEIYYPANNSASSYYCIRGHEVVEIGSIDTKYYFDDTTYTYFKGYKDGKYFNTIIATDAEGEVTKDYKGTIGNGTCIIIPCEYGLVIHNAISPDMLYFIDGGSGDVIKLFSVEGERTLSAVNVYEEYVYISFLRYQDYDQLWFGRFENDALEGTYRINLKKLSVEKISDAIYNGLYIFDDTGIYACDNECNIYKLDFEGNVIMTLLEH